MIILGMSRVSVLFVHFGPTLSHILKPNWNVLIGKIISYKERNIQNFVREWNGLYVSVEHSLILPWTHIYKLIERPHFLGTSGIGLKMKKCSQVLLIFGFEFHCSKVHSLVLIFWNLHSICYQLRMKQIC